MDDLLAMLQPGTRAKYALDLAQLSDWLSPQGLSLSEVSPALFVRYTEAKGWAPTTCRGVLSAVRWYLKASGHADHPLTRFRLKRIEPLPGRVVTAEEFRRLLGACDVRRDSGARDLALFLVMGQTGIRASEVCALRLADLDLDHDRLRVIAKGGRPQWKQLDALTISYLEAWLDLRELIGHCDSVFVNVHTGQPLTRHGLGVICRRAARRAGIPTFRPHAMRRFMATEATRNGAPLSVTMQQGGWRSYSSFARYVLSLTPGDFAPFSPVEGALRC